MKRQSILVGVIVIWTLITTANGSEWQLVETIQLSNVSILDITSDGTNFIVLDNDYSRDRLGVFNTSGEFIKSFDTWTQYTSGIAWNGEKAVFSAGNSASSKKLYEMDLDTGEVSGPFTESLGHVFGLGYDGTNIFVTDNKVDWYFLDASTYLYVGTPQYFNPEAGKLVGLGWGTGPTYGTDF